LGVQRTEFHAVVAPRCPLLSAGAVCAPAVTEADVKVPSCSRNDDFYVIVVASSIDDASRQSRGAP